MAVDTVHILHGIQVGAAGSFYSQIEDHNLSLAITEVLGRPTGLPYAMFRGIRGVKPEVTFRTSQLTTLFTDCALAMADLSAGNVDLFFKKVLGYGTRVPDATTQHTRVRIAKAGMHVVSLAAAHNGEATAQARLFANYDGTNIPIVVAGTLALTGTPTAAQYFSLGSVYVNTVAIDGIQSCGIDFGWTTIERGSASEAYDTFYALKAMNPVITLSGLSLEEWATYGIVGAPLTALSIYLRKVSIDATGGICYVVNGTAEHIKFSATAGIVTVQQARGSGEEEETTLRIFPRAASAVLAPMAVAVNTAITT
jgi:hypothetical protein